MHCLTDAVVQFCKLQINIIVHEGHPVKEEENMIGKTIDTEKRKGKETINNIYIYKKIILDT